MLRNLAGDWTEVSTPKVGTVVFEARDRPHILGHATAAILYDWDTQRARNPGLCRAPGRGDRLHRGNRGRTGRAQKRDCGTCQNIKDGRTYVRAYTPDLCRHRSYSIEPKKTAPDRNPECKARLCFIMSELNESLTKSRCAVGFVLWALRLSSRNE
jgi:hypothetical protein